MKLLKTLLFLLFLFITTSVIKAQNYDSTKGTTGLFFSPSGTNHNNFINNFDLLCEELKKQGINTVVLDLEWLSYKYKNDDKLSSLSYPATGGFTFTELNAIANKARNRGLKLMVMLQVLTHQNYGVVSHAYPEYMLKENAWVSGKKYTVNHFVEINGVVYDAKSNHVSSENNKPGSGASWKKFWTTSYRHLRDPYNTDGNALVNRMIDEIIEATTVNGVKPDGIHLGGDEGLYWSEVYHGNNKGEAFAKAFINANNHIKKNHPGVKVVMWGDMLDSNFLGGQYGSSGAIDYIPKDIIIADWRYRNVDWYNYDAANDEFPSLNMFVKKGFTVWPASWKSQDAAKTLIKNGNQISKNGGTIYGHLYTTWSDNVVPGLKKEFVSLGSSQDETMKKVANSIKNTISLIDLNNSTTSYTLTVNNGSGDGSYSEGSTVTITSDAAPTGKVFDSWTGDVSTVADVKLSSTTLKMPAKNIAITASYKDQTTPNGDIEVTGDGTPDLKGSFVKHTTSDGLPNYKRVDLINGLQYYLYRKTWAYQGKSYTAWFISTELDNYPSTAHPWFYRYSEAYAGEYKPSGNSGATGSRYVKGSTSHPNGDIEVTGDGTPDLKGSFVKHTTSDGLPNYKRVDLINGLQYYLYRKTWAYQGKSYTAWFISTELDNYPSTAHPWFYRYSEAYAGEYKPSGNSGATGSRYVKDGGGTNFGTENKINSVTAPDSVKQGQSVAVTVKYTASEDRKIECLIQLAKDPWTVYAYQTKQVGSGTGSIDFTLHLPEDIPVGDSYQFQNVITTINGSWNERLHNMDKRGIRVTAGTNSAKRVDSKELLIAKNLNIYPNPSKGIFTIKHLSDYKGKVRIDIFSIEGRRVKSIHLDKNTNALEYSLHLEDLAKGVYIVQYKENSKKLNKQIIKM